MSSIIQTIPDSSQKDRAEIRNKQQNVVNYAKTLSFREKLDLFGYFGTFGIFLTNQINRLTLTSFWGLIIIITITIGDMYLQQYVDGSSYVHHVDETISSGEVKTFFVEELGSPGTYIFISSDDFSSYGISEISIYSHKQGEEIFYYCSSLSNVTWVEGDLDSPLQYCEDIESPDSTIHRSDAYDGHLLLGIVNTEAVDFIKITNNGTADIFLVEGNQIYFHDGVYEKFLIKAIYSFLLSCGGVFIVGLLLGKKIPKWILSRGEITISNCVCDGKKKVSGGICQQCNGIGHIRHLRRRS